MIDISLAYFISEIIEKAGYKSALIGGVAVGVWTEERFTKDLDFALAVKTDKDAETLVKTLRDSGFAIHTVLEHTSSKSLAVVILSSPKIRGITHRVDLIFMQSGIENEVVVKAIEFKDNKKSLLRVARIGHLIALKTLSMDDKTRPQDRLDLMNLLKIADKNDLNEAKESLKLITIRGFNQEKDLEKRLNVMIKS